MWEMNGGLELGGYVQNSSDEVRTSYSHLLVASSGLFLLS